MIALGPVLAAVLILALFTPCALLTCKRLNKRSER